MYFLSKNCSNCFFIFDLSNCQGGVGGVGWGGGMITFLELAHMFDATQNGGFGMLTFFELAYMLMLRKCAHMFDAIRKCAHMFELRKLVSSGC